MGAWYDVHFTHGSSLTFSYSSYKLQALLCNGRNENKLHNSFRLYVVFILNASPDSHNNPNRFSSRQSLIRVWLSVTPWKQQGQASLSATSTRSLLKPMSTESAMPANHLILCRPFSSRLQSFPALGSFTRSQFFASGSQSIGVSASALVLPMNIQDWFPLGLTTVEVRSKFKGLDLIDRVPMMNYGRRFLTLYRRQWSRPSPWKRNAKKQNGYPRKPYK